jgi:hypothetical protein
MSLSVILSINGEITKNSNNKCVPLFKSSLLLNNYLQDTQSLQLN